MVDGNLGNLHKAADVAKKAEFGGVETCPMGQFETVWEDCEYGYNKEYELEGREGAGKNRAILEGKEIKTV